MSQSAYSDADFSSTGNDKAFFRPTPDINSPEAVHRRQLDQVIERHNQETALLQDQLNGAHQAIAELGESLRMRRSEIADMRYNSYADRQGNGDLWHETRSLRQQLETVTADRDRLQVQVNLMLASAKDRVVASEAKLRKRRVRNGR